MFYFFRNILKTQTSFFIELFLTKLQQKYTPSGNKFLVFFSPFWSPNVSKLEQFVRTLNARYAGNGPPTIKIAPSFAFKTPQENGAELALVLRLLRFSKVLFFLLLLLFFRRGYGIWQFVMEALHKSQEFQNELPNSLSRKSKKTNEYKNINFYLK